MDLQGKGFPLKLVRGAVLLVSLALMAYQAYLSLAEYQKHEYVQTPEDSTLSGVSPPRVIVCHEQGFRPGVTTSQLMGMTRSPGKFFGWGEENMTTKEYLGSLATVQEKNQLLIKAHLAESVTSGGTKIKDEKLRISFVDGQCYSISIPKIKDENSLIGKNKSANVSY